MGALQALRLMGVDLEKDMPLPLTVLYELGVLGERDPKQFVALAAYCLRRWRAGDIRARDLVRDVRQAKRRRRLFAMRASTLEGAR
jgi:hypothetical protein